MCAPSPGREEEYRTKISGFTFVRNALDLYYPVVESINSILPICDEFVVVAGDSTDGTTELLRSIESPKLKIVETVWDPALFVRGAIFAQQTNLALQACRGDWAFYLQADEVIHERHLPTIEERMRRYLDDARVEGLLFDYLHFFGDYEHVQISHNWYGHEVRIVRTGIGVRSWHDAQGFRVGDRKLQVAHAGACVYHYGWVRPLVNLGRKRRAFALTYDGDARRDVEPGKRVGYGRLWGLRRFEGAHPAVMDRRRREFSSKVERTPPCGHKHDRVAVQLLSRIENQILGVRVGERRNYQLLPECREGRGLSWRQWIAAGR